MSAAVPTNARLFRRPGSWRPAGVAAGIAEHIGVRVRLVRLAFIALAAAGGLGVALYGAYWIVLPPAPDARPSRIPIWLEYLLAGVVAIAAIAGVAYAMPLGGVFAPTLLACLGGALIWRQATEPERDRWRRISRTSLSADREDRLGRIRLASGAALVVAGGAIVLARANFSAIRDGLLAVVVTVIGMALLTGPWWMRMMSQLGAERSERIRSQERADIAAHLHDSVLQTLALIQRNSASPREVTRLARGQERELRTLLYEPRAASERAGRRAAARRGRGRGRLRDLRRDGRGRRRRAGRAAGCGRRGRPRGAGQRGQARRRRRRCRCTPRSRPTR